MPETVKSKRGGARPGAGRPKGSTKEISRQRPQHQLRAWPDEWELILRFARIIKHADKEASSIALDELEKKTMQN